MSIVTKNGIGAVYSDAGHSTFNIAHTFGGANQTDALIIASFSIVSSNATIHSVLGITDSEGNTWERYFTVSDNSGWRIPDLVGSIQKGFTAEIWFTRAAIANASITITPVFDAVVDCVSVNISPKHLGYDHTDPFDLNPSLPMVLRAHTGTTAESISGISTDTTHIYPYWFFASMGTNIAHSNVVFNGVNRDDQEQSQYNAGSEFLKNQMASGPAATGPYASVTFASPTSADNFYIIGFALTGDVQSVPVIDPLDGTRILEWTSNAIQTRRYQEADYDSIWSRGDRVANGLITTGDYGFTGMFAPMSQGFDNNYGTGLGNGPTPVGDTSAPFYPAMSTAVWWDTAPWNLELHGIKWLGTETITADGTSWRVVGGFALGSLVVDSYALEFDNFIIWQDTTDPELGGSLLSRTMDFTPRSPVSWPHYELIRPLDESFGNPRLANEFLLKVTHSILDGGDRRASNGRAEKQVAFSMSSNWTFTAGAGLTTPASGLFDGLYNRSASSETAKGGADCVLIKSVTGSGQHPQITAGEWLQFAFPRKVRMHHLVFNLANGDLETLDSGGNPMFYGKWHWEVSDIGTDVSFVPLGSVWHFTETSEFMLAPAATPAAGFGLPDDGGHKYWRMVLDLGPAFGNDKLLAQVLFHLDDPGNQDVGFSVAFTDDIDAVPPTLEPPVPGSPWVLLFTDSFSDGLTLSLTNTPNPLLSIAFTDGTTDQLEMFSDLFPSQVVQTYTSATGR